MDQTVASVRIQNNLRSILNNKGQETMTNDLAVPSSTGITVAQTFNNDLFDKLAGDSYLGYLSLVQANSDVAKPPYMMPQGHYVLVEAQKPKDLGQSVCAAVIAWRPLARIIDKSGQNTAIASFFDPESEAFKEAMARSEGKQDGTIIYYFGFEYLLYLDEEGKFCTFYCNSKTSRRAAREQIHPLLDKVAVLTSQFIETKAFSWWGPQANMSTVALSNLPDVDDLKRILYTFQNPKSEEAVVEGSEAAAESEDR